VLKTISIYEVWLDTITQGRGNLYFLDLYLITGNKNESIQMILVHNLFNLKARSGLFVLKANKNTGNKMRKGIIKLSANQSFQIGERI